MNKKKYLFYWEGLNLSGHRQEGTMEAGKASLVKNELAKQGIISKKIYRQYTGLFAPKIRQAELALFSRQLATMLKTGIPLMQAFKLVSAYASPSMKGLIAVLQTEVETGSSFSEALGKQPHYFNQLICNLIDTGEKSGKLDLMLDRLAADKERNLSLRKKLRTALAYPCVVLTIALIVSLALLNFVVPQFEAMYHNFGAEIPRFTCSILSLSKFCQDRGLLLVFLISISAYALVQAQKQSAQFAYWLDRKLLRLPFFGPLAQAAILARFARTLALCFAAGLPLFDSLSQVAGVTANRLYAQATEQLKADITKGQRLQHALQRTKLFTSFLIQMVGIGEESGNLETVLNNIAQVYEEKVNTTLDSLANLLEPLIMAILGILIGALVIAMYLPLFNFGSVM